MRCALVVTVLALLPQDQDKVTLKWKFDKGQVLRYELQQKIVVESDTLSWDVANTFVLKQTVKEVSDKGEATCEVVHEAVKSIMSGFVTVEYDSAKDKDPADPVGQAIAKLVGASFTMKIDATGTLTSVTGFDKIQAKMLEVMGEGTEMAQGVVKQLFNDDAQRGLLQQAFVQFPKDPVAPGGTWKNEYPLEMGVLGKFSFHTTGTLKSVKGDEGRIVQEIQVKPDNSSAGLLELSEGKGKSDAVFSIDKGRLSESKLEAELKMKMGDSEFPVKLTAKLKFLPDDKK